MFSSGGERRGESDANMDAKGLPNEGERHKAMPPRAPRSLADARARVTRALDTLAGDTLATRYHTPTVDPWTDGSQRARFTFMGEYGF